MKYNVLMETGICLNAVMMDGEMLTVILMGFMIILLQLLALDQVCYQNFACTYVNDILFFFFFTDESCTEGDIRLAHGANSFEGRVEVCRNSEWGTVCDNYWSRNEGIVACRQLGLPYVAISKNSFHGPGTGQIWLDDLSCHGSESRLFDCPHRIRWNYCDHYRDAGLVCGSK